MNARDTLVIFHAALGDGVLLWPQLRELVPLTLVGPGGWGRLSAREIPGVDAADDGTAGWARLFAPTSPDVVESLRRAAPPELLAARRVVSFVSDGHDAWARNVEILRPDLETHFARATPPPDSTVHVVEYRRRQLARSGLETDVEIATPARVGCGRPTTSTAGTAGSSSSTRMTRGAQRTGATVVVVAPGSGSPAKCWPAARFEALADGLREHGAEVRIVVGHVEQERMDAALLERWRRRFDLRCPPTPLELADDLRDAAAYIGNDSGPTHLAAQLGVPTIALFGPTDPGVWSPVGRDVRVLAPPQPAPMERVDTDAVLDAALDALGNGRSR